MINDPGVPMFDEPAYVPRETTSVEGLVHELWLQGIEGLAHVKGDRYRSHQLLSMHACRTLLQGDSLLSHGLTSLMKMLEGSHKGLGHPSPCQIGELRELCHRIINGLVVLLINRSKHGFSYRIG